MCFQLQQRFVLTVYGAILPLVLMCHKAVIQSIHLRWTRWPLDYEIHLFYHAFIMSRIDYCNSVLAGAFELCVNKLHRILNAAACILSKTIKYDRRLTWIRLDNLHWLDIPYMVKLKFGLTVWDSTDISNGAMQTGSIVEGCCHLRSDAHGQLLVSCLMFHVSYIMFNCWLTEDKLLHMLAHCSGTLYQTACKTEISVWIIVNNQKLSYIKIWTHSVY